MFKRLKYILYQFFEASWYRLVHIGVTPAMSFVEARRTKLLNLLAIPCIPMMFFFAVLNAFQGRWLLSVLNIVNTLSCLAVFYFHKRRKYLSARMVLIFFSTAIYAFTGLYFHNGAEYFLLNILIASILVYDNKWMVAGLSVIICSAFLLIVLYPQHWSLAEPVPASRVWVNIGFSIIFVPVSLSFFKRIQNDYHAELDRQRQVLAGMNKDKEKLLSIVTHDIRSPLATLEMLLEMFSKGEYPQPMMEDAAVVLHKKVTQLGGALDNVLRWSSRNMRGIKTEPEDFLLPPLITEILHFFQMVVQEKDIRITVDVSPIAAVHADRDQVAVILRNLLSNALKFSYAGGHISLTVHREGTRKVVQVSDEGKGMTPTQVSALFTSWQNPDYGTGGERGTGVGLMLCNEFARQNGGVITVESAPEQGTRFTVYLPAGELPASSAS
ncbi:sensor histidine kinase [Chitinophaga lutea]|uniref:histidine kinase n=1 Tax=Chitinophaga lutea TaxID=2488634 RepID=A0A3N4PYU9_9BACT|nr:HAMP domain-containing sensor histidine kinase [Chitinophaga lutea]RPE12069.1 sensor histidine kinase [Chitinophaga lutea]